MDGNVSVEPTDDNPNVLRALGSRLFGFLKKDVKVTSSDVEVEAVGETRETLHNCPEEDHDNGDRLETSDEKEVSRWDFIKEALTKCVITHDSDPLQDAILSYNSTSDWQFDTLYNFSVSDQHSVFKAVTPKIITLALSLSQDVWRSPPRLRQGVAGEVALSQREIAALLANAFLCTFPQREQVGKLPNINFDQLFENDSVRKQEKLKCIFNYFHRVGQCSSENVVTFKRLVVKIGDMPRWRKSVNKLCDLVVSSSGSIEEEGAEMLQVDFANKYIGGGVLGNGLVQEEIRFVSNPELIAARLFADVLLDNEALLMTGSECFSKFTGYSDSFRFAGSHVDSTPLDERKRRKCAIVAIDATWFRRHEMSRQFEPRAIQRETNKAYVGFLADGFDRSAPVATGNWGCGAFNGDPRLKALLQLMAASEAGRSLRYFTYGDHYLAKDIEEMHQMLVHHAVTVGELYSEIDRYKCSTQRSLYQTLHDWLEPQLDEIADDTQQGSTADYTQQGSTAHDMQRGLSADVPQIGSTADEPQLDLSANDSQFKVPAGDLLSGFNADGCEFKADESKCGSNADISQFDIPAYDSQHETIASVLQLELTAASSCFETKIETSPGVSTCARNVAVVSEKMDNVTVGDDSNVILDAGKDDLQRNADATQGGTGNEATKKAQTNAAAIEDASSVNVNKIDILTTTKASEIKASVKEADEAVNAANGAGHVEPMEVDEDPSDCNVPEERKGDHVMSEESARVDIGNRQDPMELE